MDTLICILLKKGYSVAINEEYRLLTSVKGTNIVYCWALSKNSEITHFSKWSGFNTPEACVVDFNNHINDMIEKGAL